jgi:RNA polymerase sigma-70 factor (ECF subfamily)
MSSASESTLAAALPHAAERVRPHVEEVVGLYGSLRRPLLRYALTFGVLASDVEEVVQETFLALFKHLESGKSRQNLPGWAFRVCHNLALKQREKAMKLMNSEAEWSAQHMQAGLNPEQQLLQAQRRAKLQAVLTALPEQDRCCISLRAEGLRYREIAEILDISLGAVSLSLTRSLKKFEHADRE